MRVVIQEETTGCGLACVAMLAGMSYAAVREAAAELGIYAADEALFSDSAYVRRLLAHFGVEADRKETPFTAWAQLPDLALLATKQRFEAGRLYWHWAVFAREPDGAVVLDPAPYLEENRRTDWEEMAPAWYIPVLPHGRGE